MNGVEASPVLTSVAATWVGIDQLALGCVTS